MSTHAVVNSHWNAGVSPFTKLFFFFFSGNCKNCSFRVGSIASRSSATETGLAKATCSQAGGNIHPLPIDICARIALVARGGSERFVACLFSEVSFINR